MGLLSSVPCIVTFTGLTTFDGVAGTPTADDITLAANIMRHVTAVGGNCSAVSVSPNTEVSGVAGVIKINVLYS